MKQSVWMAEVGERINGYWPELISIVLAIFPFGLHNPFNLQSKVHYSYKINMLRFYQPYLNNAPFCCCCFCLFVCRCPLHVKHKGQGYNEWWGFSLSLPFFFPLSLAHSTSRLFFPPTPRHFSSCLLSSFFLFLQSHLSPVRSLNPSLFQSNSTSIECFEIMVAFGHNRQISKGYTCWQCKQRETGTLFA